MKEIKCPECGELNTINASFCKKCGSRFEVNPMDEEKKDDHLKSEVESDKTILDDESLSEVEVENTAQQMENIEQNLSNSEKEIIEPEPKIYEQDKSMVNLSVRKNNGRNASIHIIISMLSSVALAYIFQKLISINFDSESYIYRLFFPPGDSYQRIIPLLILFLFFWVLVDLIIKLIVLGKGKRNLNRKPLQNIPYMIQIKSLDSILNQLKELMKKRNHVSVYRIIYTVLDTLNSSKDIQRSHELFRHQIDIEADTSQSSYTISRIFIWAMPILGFIGTVLGISIAVEHFSGFLTGDIEEIDVVKRELSNVATGLSFAFGTTLLGLGSSLISMLLTSFAQKNEENHITSIEELGLDIISNYKAIPAISSSDESVEVIDRSIAKIEEFFNTQTQALSNSLITYNDAIKNTTENYSKLLSKFPENMKEIEDNFIKELGAVQIKIEESEKSVKVKLDNLDEVSKSLGEIYEVGTKEFRSSSENLIQKVETLSESRKFIAKAIEAIEAQNKILTDMHEAQESTVNYLKNLTGPFEIKLVNNNQNDRVSK